MSPTYKATGINLKSMPLGESDRLLTILTREFGLVRAVAPGTRKPQSKLGGRSSLFVINSLLMSKGRTLDKLLQAETLESFPGLSRDLGKLTAAQYLAELVVLQALGDQPQEELFTLLNEHLKRLEQSPRSAVLAYLTHAIFQLLMLAGIAPQVESCCSSQVPIAPNFSEPNWKVGFSPALGGTIALPDYNDTRAEEQFSVSALELALLQQLPHPELPQVSPIPGLSLWDTSPSVQSIWLTIEKLLRGYAQYHFDRSIRSAALVETCFTSY
jgi:DNA repair protein RecO (recombination protein O)